MNIYVNGTCCGCASCKTSIFLQVYEQEGTLYLITGSNDKMVHMYNVEVKSLTVCFACVIYACSLQYVCRIMSDYTLHMLYNETLGRPTVTIK